MGCCGRSRASIQSVRASVTRLPPEPIVEDSVRLEYAGSGAIMVRGPATGQGYAFSPGMTAAVDRRDADALRRTRLFR
jgi:hypothetical protein